MKKFISDENFVGDFFCYNRKNFFTVIYTERGERNRIISARKADKDEVEQYYEQFGY